MEPVTLDVFNVVKEEALYYFPLFLADHETVGAGAGIHEAYFSCQAGIQAYICTFSVLFTVMMNFAPQSGSCHQIKLVFGESQMLGFHIHSIQPQHCNYALKGLEDATAITGRLPTCLLMWQSNLSLQQMERSAAQGYNSKLLGFFHPYKHLLPLNRSRVASLIPCFPANHTLSSLSDCFL